MRAKKDRFFPPITEIRKKVSLEEIMTEQQTTPITYEEIRDMNQDIDWKYSLAEMLEALD